MTWNDLESLHLEYKNSDIENNIDYNKFYIYSIIAHSTAIEGSTLTEEEIANLLDHDITTNKSFFFHLMNKDLENAYIFAQGEAIKKTAISPDFLKKLSEQVMRATGAHHKSILGEWDESRGDFRLCNVTAGFGGRSYPSYTKIESSLKATCEVLEKGLINASSIKDKYLLSFKAHLDLVTIHPWSDGNGRTARLLMNYCQFRTQIVPTKIFSTEKEEYISVIKTAQVDNKSEPYFQFMLNQQLKTLKEELLQTKQNNHEHYI